MTLLPLPQVHCQPQRHLCLHGGVERTKLPLGEGGGARNRKMRFIANRIYSFLTEMRHILFSEKLGTIVTSSLSAKNSTSAGSIPSAQNPALQPEG